MSVIEIFRAGRHTAADGAQVEITQADLERAALVYDPAASEAPLVVGHPASGAPAYGWVTRLKTSGSALLAELIQVDRQMAGLVKNGRYKKVSASFYTPKSPDNPRPGSWYLRHVGLLGAMPPAVKGLAEVSFSETATGVMEFTSDPACGRVAGILERVKSLLAEKFGQGEADTAVPAEDLAALDTESAANAAPQAASRESMAPIADNAELQKVLARLDLAHFVDGLARDGRIMPRHVELIKSLLAGLPEDSFVEFSENGRRARKCASMAFRQYLSELPSIIDFSERSAASMDEASALLGGKIAQAAKNGK